MRVVTSNVKLCSKPVFVSRFGIVFCWLLVFDFLAYLGVGLWDNGTTTWLSYLFGGPRLSIKCLILSTRTQPTYKIYKRRFSPYFTKLIKILWFQTFYRIKPCHQYPKFHSVNIVYKLRFIKTLVGLDSWKIIEVDSTTNL